MILFFWAKIRFFKINHHPTLTASLLSSKKWESDEEDEYGISSLKRTGFGASLEVRMPENHLGAVVRTPKVGTTGYSVIGKGLSLSGHFAN